MADTNHLFTWDELKGNDQTAPKKLVTAFKRAGAEMAASWVAEKTKRENSITYREIGFTLADSQTIVLRVKQTGDIYQVRMNGKVLPMKEQDDIKKALAEIVNALDANATKFQKALARKKATPPKGAATTRVTRKAALESQEADLDGLIAEAQATLDTLQGGV